MIDQESEKTRRPGVAEGRREPAPSEPSPARTGTPGKDSSLAALRVGNYAGFAVRRVPPPDGSPADAPWRIVPPAASYNGSLPQPDAAIDTPPAAPAPRRPLFPPPSVLERLVPPGPDAEPADPTRPAARARPVSGGPDDPYRGLTRIRSDRTAQPPPDPKSPVGPNPDRASALVQARVDQRDKRRASRGRSRQDAATGDGYVQTSSTQAKLIQRGQGLFARYRRESGVQLRKEDVDPRNFVDWLFSLKPMLASSSSWRIYRASVMAWLQTVPHDGLEEALAVLEADIGIGADGGRARPRGRRGGLARSEPAKRFDKADFDTLMNKVGNLSRSKAGPWLRDWVSAGINTGLQPSEWAAVDLEVRNDPSQRHGRRALLYVLNAKASAAGGNRIERILDISNFSDIAFDAVRRHAERATEWSLAQKFEMRQSQCAQLLYEVCSVLFPRQQQRYSLYSLRHQFIANMKDVYEPAEVAALVGQISDADEAVEHYGKRRAAWLRAEIHEVPVPMPEQVKKMRRQWELYVERRKAKMMRRALAERRHEAARAKAKAKKPEPER
jgi:hypothetical protein